jgi:hypothetical protein
MPLMLSAEKKTYGGTCAGSGCSQHMKVPIRKSHAVSAKRLDWQQPHVRNAVALLGLALLIAALHFYGPTQLQFGVDYDASEIREAPSKIVLPDVWLPWEA